MTFLDDTESVNHGVDLPVNRVELAAFIDLMVTSPNALQMKCGMWLHGQTSGG